MSVRSGLINVSESSKWSYARKKAQLRSPMSKQPIIWILNHQQRK